MGKDAYYFSHDANARQDEKILMLRADYGWEGYGIYWALVEMMFESSETALHHNKIKGIAVSYNIDITLLDGVINTCITEDLFATDGEKFWSESLRRRKNKYQEIKRKKSEAGKKGMAKRWGKQQDDNSVITKDSGVITENNKGKESKGKERKENTTSRPKRVYDTDSIYYHLASTLYGEILKNMPDKKEPNLNSWADDFRKLIELDGKKPEHVETVIKWTQSNAFWWKNVLSASKFREQYERLAAEIRTERQKVKPFKLRHEEPNEYVEEKKVVSSFDGSLF